MNDNKNVDINVDEYVNEYMGKGANWSIDELKALLDNADICDGEFEGADLGIDNGQYYKRVYLGSILCISPSGKLYMPWATSNVMGCGLCNGTGEVDNKHRDAKMYDRLHRFDNNLRCDMHEKYGSVADGKWPSAIVKLLKYTRNAYMDFVDKITCPACNGCGSEEAYADECWHEDLENKLDSIDAWLGGCEGDGCSMFACRHLTDEEKRKWRGDIYLELENMDYDDLIALYKGIGNELADDKCISITGVRDALIEAVCDGTMNVSKIMGEMY